MGVMSFLRVELHRVVSEFLWFIIVLAISGNAFGPML